MKKDPYTIIKTVSMTEKSNILTEQKQYTFIVHPEAKKPDIKRAVESLFEQKVKSVNVINGLGKTKRTKYGYGKKADWKKAIVTIKQGEIKFF
jgi:large subunit ribosomal protein L23